VLTRFPVGGLPSNALVGGPPTQSSVCCPLFCFSIKTAGVCAKSTQKALFYTFLTLFAPFYLFLTIFYQAHRF